jgi:hypothetical protein
LNNYIECLLKWRQEVQNWLEGHIEKLDGPFPFNIYNNFFIKEVLRFCDPSMFEFTINPLNLWPMNYNDYLALAACIKNYNFFLHDRQGKLETGIFNPEKVCAWISKHMKSMEKLFFESSNPKAQQLLSDAMGVII